MNNFNKIGEIPYDGQENIFYTDNTATSKEKSRLHNFPVDPCGVTIPKLDQFLIKVLVYQAMIHRSELLCC